MKRQLSPAALPNSTKKAKKGKSVSHNKYSLTATLPSAEHTFPPSDNSNLKLELSSTWESIEDLVNQANLWRNLGNNQLLANLVLHEFIETAPSKRIGPKLTKPIFKPSCQDYAACYIIFAAINLPANDQVPLGPLAVRLVHHYFVKDEETEIARNKSDIEFLLNTANKKIVNTAGRMLYSLTENAVIDWFLDDLKSAIKQNNQKPIVKASNGKSKGSVRLPMYKRSLTLSDQNRGEDIKLELSLERESIVAQLEKLNKGWTNPPKKKQRKGKGTEAERLEVKKIADLVLKEFIRLAAPAIISETLSPDKFQPTVHEYGGCYIILSEIDLPKNAKNPGPLAVQLAHQCFGKDEKTGKVKTKLDIELSLNIRNQRIVTTACQILHPVIKNDAIIKFSMDLKSAIAQNQKKEIVRAPGGKSKNSYRFPMYSRSPSFQAGPDRAPASKKHEAKEAPSKKSKTPPSVPPFLQPGTPLSSSIIPTTPASTLETPDHSQDEPFSPLSLNQLPDGDIPEISYQGQGGLFSPLPLNLFPAPPLGHTLPETPLQSGEPFSPSPLNLSPAPLLEHTSLGTTPEQNPYALFSPTQQPHTVSEIPPFPITSNKQL